MAQTVIGFFDDASDAQTAVSRLESMGLSRDRIDVSRGNTGNTGTTNVSEDRDSENGVSRFFKSLFGNDNDDADRYSKVGQNSTIVTVHAQSEDEADRAADVLDDCGAVDVDERASQYGYTNTRNTESMGERQNARSTSDDTTFNRVEENLEVGKREVERGGVRVRSRIVERPVEEHIRLREEHVHIERNPVDRPVTDADMRALQDRDIELTERAEVPVVNKEARVVEEIRVGKEVSERNETVRDTVRNTEIDVDNIDGGRNTNTDMDNTNTRRGL